MDTKSVTTAEFIRHFGRYHDEARRAPITLTKHGRESLVVLSAELFERLAGNEDPPGFVNTPTSSLTAGAAPSS